MVAAVKVEKSNGKTESDERTAVEASAKMHLGISLAKVLYLHETGLVPKDLTDLIHKLHLTSDDYAGSLPPPQSAKPSPPSFEAKNPPVRVSAAFDYTPATHQDLVARRGDLIVVYASTDNHQQAIAYNTRNHTAGRIPYALLDSSEAEDSTQDKLYLTTAKLGPGPVGHVTWRAGDYVRVWGREDGKALQTRGFCFNLASGAIGRFSTVSCDLKLID